MFSQSYQELDENLLKFYNKFMREKCEVLRTSVIDNSTLEAGDLSNDLFLKLKGLNEKILIGVLQWYMPEEVKFQFNLWLAENWGGDFKEYREVLCVSKISAVGFLLVQERWNENDFYGNILKKELIKNFLKVQIQKRKKASVKKPAFKRGYNDKGSLRPTHITPMYNYRKFRTTTQQLLIEENEKIILEELIRNISLRIELEQVV